MCIQCISASVRRVYERTHGKKLRYQNMKRFSSVKNRIKQITDVILWY